MGAVTSVAVYKTWHAVPQGSYSIHSGQSSWLLFTLSGCPHYPMRCTYMYALYSSGGRATGNTLRAQSILVQGHAYTGNHWPHPPRHSDSAAPPSEYTACSVRVLHVCIQSAGQGGEHHMLSYQIPPLAHCLPLSRWTVWLIGK